MKIEFLSIMTEFQKLYYCFDAVKLNRYIGIDGARGKNGSLHV
jgi:hypothetical protein